MDPKVLLGIIAALLAAASSYAYIRDIFRGNTKPHIYTWLIWSIVTLVIFLGQRVSGGGAGSWSTGVAAVLTIGIFFLSLRYGTKDITRFDTLCLFLALASLIPWLLTKNVLISVLLATFTDVIAFFPTMRKTWHAPRSESLGSMFFDTSKHVLSIASLQAYSTTTLAYPVAVLITKLAIIGEIMYLRLVKKPALHRI